MNQVFGVCNLALAPLRAEASDRSEMISQLLFGDHFEILETSEKWARIRTAYDDYEGWIDPKQYVETNLETFTRLHDLKNILSAEVVHPVKNLKNNEILNLLAGSNLPDFKEGRFSLNDAEFATDAITVNPGLTDFISEVEHVSRLYLNTPYLWGGRSVFGIDCSGFTQMVFKHFGIKLKRDAWQQALQGEPVDFVQESNLGDLAFFDNEEGKIIHVGIILNPEHIIHASGRVKVDKLDTSGIYSEELQRYTHKLRIIKRFI
ncbi:MAG: C40 family peptidase [Daejeonella sp.]